METFTEDSLKMESCKERVLIGGQMGQSIEEAFKMDYCMAWESGCQSRTITMKDSTDRIKNMDLGLISGAME